MINLRRLPLLLATLLLAASTLTACGDTWKGMKEDTSDNMKATGEAVENAGEKINP